MCLLARVGVQRSVGPWWQFAIVFYVHLPRKTLLSVLRIVGEGGECLI